MLRVIEEEKTPYLFSSDQLMQLLLAITSVKTRIAIVGLIGPRLTDPSAKSTELLALFRFSEEKSKVEEILKARITTLKSTAFRLSTSASLQGGRGQNRMSVNQGGRGMTRSSQSVRLSAPVIEETNKRKSVATGGSAKMETDPAERSAASASLVAERSISEQAVISETVEVQKHDSASNAAPVVAAATASTNPEPKPQSAPLVSFPSQKEEYPPAGAEETSSAKQRPQSALLVPFPSQKQSERATAEATENTFGVLAGDLAFEEDDDDVSVATYSTAKLTNPPPTSPDSTRSTIQHEQENQSFVRRLSMMLPSFSAPADVSFSGVPAKCMGTLDKQGMGTIYKPWSRRQFSYIESSRTVVYKTLSGDQKGSVKVDTTPAKLLTTAEAGGRQFAFEIFVFKYKSRDECDTVRRRYYSTLSACCCCCCCCCCCFCCFCFCSCSCSCSCSSGRMLLLVIAFVPLLPMADDIAC